jgi:glutamine cyclotransferase
MLFVTVSAVVPPPSAAFLAIGASHFTAGPTEINRIDPASGRVERLTNLGNAVFGEGITVLGGQLFQLTWRNHKVFVWNLEGNLLREMRT